MEGLTMEIFIGYGNSAAAADMGSTGTSVGGNDPFTFIRPGGLQVRRAAV